MTPALAVIDKIRSSGGSIWSEDGDLLIEVQPGILTREDTEALATYKAELLLTGGTTLEALRERTNKGNHLSFFPQNGGSESELGCEQSEQSEQSPIADGSSSSTGCEQSELCELSPITIRAEHTPDGLRLHCPPEVAAAIEAGRDQLETILAGGDQDQADQDDHRRIDETMLVDPVACEKCGSLAAWFDLLDQRHCAKCDPPIVAQRLRQHAERIRRRHHHHQEA